MTLVANNPRLNSSDEMNSEGNEVVLMADDSQTEILSSSTPNEGSEEEDDEEEEESKPTGLGPVYLSTFLDIMGIAIIIPVLPYIVLDSTGGDETKLGNLLALYSGAQMIGSIVMGYLSDRLGRRPIILASIMGSATGFLFIGLVILLVQSEDLYVWLIVARVYSGLWGGSVPVSQAYIADVTSQKQRPKYLGLVGATIGTAFTLGPGVGGGFLAAYEAAGLEGLSARAAVFFTAFAFSFLGFLYSFVRLKEPKRRGAEILDEGIAESDDLADEDIERTVTDDLKTVDGFEVNQDVDKIRLFVILLSVFALNYAFNVMQTTYAVWIKDNLNWKEGELSAMLVASGVVIVIVQGAFIQPIIRRTGKHMLAVLGSWVLAAGLVGYSVITNPIPHVVVFLVFIAGYSFCNTATISLVSRYASAKTQGMAQGFNTAANSFSRVISPIVSLYIYGLSPSVFGDSAAKGILPHLLGSIVVFCSSFLVLWLLFTSRKHKSADSP